MGGTAFGPGAAEAADHNRRMLRRLLAFVIWSAVAASAVFWLLRLAVDAPPAPPHASTVAFAPSGRADWTPVLGRPAPQAVEEDDQEAEVDEAEASRFRLLGVVAPRSPRERDGVALISVDDAPAKAFRVGSAVDGATVLQSVHAFGASLGPLGGPAAVELQLPALPPPATGTLPPPGSAAAPPRPAVVPMPRALGLPGVRPPMAAPPAVAPQLQDESLPDGGDTGGRPDAS
jgi:general secretion pathway protein C